MNHRQLQLVVQRQCPGRDSAHNCGGSAVAVLLTCPVLGQGRLHVRCRVFFDKVVDVLVLCNGILQVQFIDGYDVPVIMQRTLCCSIQDILSTPPSRPSAQLATWRVTPHSTRSSIRARQWLLIRAELPSKQLSELSADTLSKLSSCQILS